VPEPDFSARWWDIAALRSLLGGDPNGGRAVGHHFGPAAEAPEFAFLAMAFPAETRSVVVLRGARAAVTVAAPVQGMPETPRVGGSSKPQRVESMDLAGVQVADWVVLFNIEPRSTRSALWFETAAAAKLKILVTGLAPGQWDIWRDGWLVEHGTIVRPTAGALYFTGAGGMYFVRPAS
jgi:hypothetical protein